MREIAYNRKINEKTEPRVPIAYNEQMTILYFSIVSGTVFGIVLLLMLRWLNKSWWKIRWIKLTAIAIPILTIISILAWFWGRRYDIAILRELGGPMAAGFLIIMSGLILSLPVSGIFNFLDRLVVRWREQANRSEFFKPDYSRRTFLRGVAASFPIMAMGAGAGGVTGSFDGTKVFKYPIEFDNLPKGLEGFRILQLSDAHLGIYKFLPDWQEIFEQAVKYKPDMILITGDVADNLEMLPGALKMAEEFKAPYGAYASLGNHEYYRGIQRVRRIFDKSTVPLLVDDGVGVNVNGSTIYIGGADDPRFLNRDAKGFYKNTVNKAVESAGSNSFKVLMSHRPEGYDPAADSGIDLTLSGHTHGGQFGIGGRSVFSSVMPGSYLWGLYGNSKSRLYVSSGIGHWFPFRLGCPTEAPVIELIGSKKIDAENS